MRAMNLVLMWSEGGLELEFSEFAENPTLDGWWELVCAQAGCKKHGKSGRLRRMAVPGEAHPLTEAQSGLWYAQRLDPANPLFNTGQYIELVGPLDLPAFEAALAQAVDEADALSLRMVDDPAGPLQFVDPANRPALEIIDVSAARQIRWWRREADIARDMATPIDPTREKLAAERLFVLGPSATSGSSASITSPSTAMG